MSNLKTLLTIIIAFSLGFAVSDYRNTRLPYQQGNVLEQTIRSSHKPAIAVIRSDVNQSNNKIITSPAIQDETPKAIFSWAQVDQLIANARYDDAIHLLETRMGDAKDAARAWLLLAGIYKKQSQPIAAVDAWFRYVKLELDDQKIEKALKDIKNYLLQLKETPTLFNEDYSWLMAQFDELLKYNTNDGELHLILAALLVQLNDDYQAQYHALMAANDPAAQKRAEVILAKLNGENSPDEATIPLTRFGNQYLVNVTIEGSPAKLLLDTGASLSGLASTYTAKYPSMLKAIKPIRLNTASGSHDSFLFTVTNISIGNLVFNQHILAQLPMDNAQGFDGLLGVDILGRFDFVIDQSAAVLKLKARKAE
jgi:predicted aspartyl protease